jgi:transposase
VSSQKSSLSLGTITLGSSDSWSTTLKKALTRDQSSTGTSSTLRRQHSQSDLNHHDDDDDVGRNPVYSPALFRSGSSSSISSQLSSLSSGSIGSWSMTSKKSNTRDQQTMKMPSTTSKKSNTRETHPKPSKESTDQERQDIMLFLRQRMKAGGILPHGTISEAAQHFGRHRNMIEKIYKELNSNERYARDQERQEIALFLSQRMNTGGVLPRGTIHEAAQHFGRHRDTIREIYKELKLKSPIHRYTKIHERQEIAFFLSQRMKAGGVLPHGAIKEAAKHFGRRRNTIADIYKELKSNERYSKDQERQDIALFLRQRMKAGGSLPYGTINEAAKHFGRHRTTITHISNELKPKSVDERQRVVADKERQDIVLFLRQRMKAGGSLPRGTIKEAAQHFDRHRDTIERIYKEWRAQSVSDRRYPLEDEKVP